MSTAFETVTRILPKISMVLIRQPINAEANKRLKAISDRRNEIAALVRNQSDITVFETHLPELEAMLVEATGLVKPLEADYSAFTKAINVHP